MVEKKEFEKRMSCLKHKCDSYRVALRDKYGVSGNVPTGSGNVVVDKKYSLFNRLNMWLCDRFGVVSLHDFDAFFIEMDGFMGFVFNRFKELDNFAKAQSNFDKNVAERLHMDKVEDKVVVKEMDDKGVYL